MCPYFWLVVYEMEIKAFSVIQCAHGRFFFFFKSFICRLWVVWWYGSSSFQHCLALRPLPTCRTARTGGLRWTWRAGCSPLTVRDTARRDSRAPTPATPCRWDVSRFLTADHDYFFFFFFRNPVAHSSSTTFTQNTFAQHGWFVGLVIVKSGTGSEVCASVVRTAWPCCLELCFF